jgi:acylphosphatase
MSEKIALHCYVSGLVQGVWYRDSTRRIAKEAGLCGWVKNLSDGRVEVLICGEKEKVYALRDWLWHGPPAAKVNDVVSEEIAWEEHEDFILVSSK